VATISVSPSTSRQEQDLLAYCEGLRQESKLAKDLTDLRDAELHLGLVRGERGTRQPRGVPPFQLNILWDLVQRKAGQATDARPTLEIVSGNPANSERCELLTKCAQALWDETVWQEQLARGIALTMQLGCNVGMVRWDPLADFGKGDIRASWYDPRAVFIDPAVTSPLHLDQAEFVVTEEVRAVASLIEQFGPRAERIKPDGDLSTYPERGSDRGVQSPAQWNFRARRRGMRSVTGQVPRAMAKHFWFRDWERDERGAPSRYVHVGYRADGTSILKPKARIIRHVATAGGCVLVDEPNPYWHQQYPIEILDWGMESDHPWGQSEIRQLRYAQETLNQFASQTLRNVNLTNNFKVISDFNALDPDTFDMLSNRAAIVIKKRPNTQIGFESPPPLPNYTFTMIQWLVSAIEIVSGMTEISKGSAAPSQSGIAIESLQMAAQTVIRLQTRRIEAFLERLFQKTISMIYQYYTGQRVLRLYGPGQAWLTHLFDRAILVFGIDPDRIKEQFRDYSFHIRPMSSLNATKVQKGVLSANLYQMGLIPGVDVLKSVDWEKPDATIQEARADQIARSQVMMATAALGGAAQPQGNVGAAARGQSAARLPASFPASGATR